MKAAMSHFCEIYILYFVWLVKYNLQNIKYYSWKRRLAKISESRRRLSIMIFVDKCPNFTLL